MSKLRLAFWGSLGSVAPEIILFYSKRFSMEPLSFDPIQYIIVSVLYTALAATIAIIYPYSRPPRPWSPFTVGVALPTIVSGIAIVFRDKIIVPRAGQGDLPSTLLDLIAWF